MIVKPLSSEYKGLDCINPVDYGLDCEGDPVLNQQALTDAIQASYDSGLSIEIPESNIPYTIQGDVDFSIDDRSISGKSNNVRLNFVDGGLRVAEDIHGDTGRVNFNSGLNNLILSRSGSVGPALLFQNSIPDNTIRSSWNNIQIRGSSGNGFEVRGGYILDIHSLYIDQCAENGIDADNSTVTGANPAGANAVRIFGGEIQSCDWAVRLHDTKCFSFFGMTYENNKSGGIILDGDNRAFGDYNGYYESNARDNRHVNNQNNFNSDIWIKGDNCACTFHTPFFADGGVAHRHAVFIEDGSNQILIDNPYFNNYGAAPIRLDAGSANTTTGQVRMGCNVRAGSLFQPLVSNANPNFVQI